ncbi:hypothetical protein L596_009458 [Steinernema carpocapsae]|uniref:Uncharacterized protein n=1 Tax=Steinernema carpocapsae TaxID=34508 RepID=A0A4U5PFE6_STECR|nr:hypothetical protein L596_009458 [Steinernema carpocapsae]
MNFLEIAQELIEPKNACNRCQFGVCGTDFGAVVIAKPTTTDLRKASRTQKRDEHVGIVLLYYTSLDHLLKL